MRGTLGQPVIIENMGGAGGTLSIARVVRSAPDGYTLGHGDARSICHLGRGLYAAVRHAERSCTGRAAAERAVLDGDAKGRLPANNLHELATLAQEQQWVGLHPPARPAWRGSAGWAFEKATGTTLQYVPYRGGAPALNDLVAGQIDLDCDLAANSLAQYRAGNVKVLAVMTKTRWAAAPDVPSVDEAGFPGLYYSTWHGIWAPKGHASRQSLPESMLPQWPRWLIRRRGSELPILA
jgi:tripartite-type tricarboxylate transporter receptor subunit TctC